MPAERSANYAWAAVVGAVALFGWGAWEVLRTPLETGSIYPPYSTLRADPLGAKVLLESLERMDELSVSRWYQQRKTIGQGTVLFVLGVDPLSWSVQPKEAWSEYEKLLAGGGRLVFAFTPTRAPGQNPDSAALRSAWNVRTLYGDAKNSDGEIPRRSALYFEAGSEWRKLAGGDIERNLAGGTVVLVADSFPLSNQGMLEARDAGRVARLVGPARAVIFDENHFGVTESGSVAGLLRKYHLVGALGMLAVVAGLFIWRNASSFLPAASVERSGAVEGRDSRNGLTQLLARSVAERELLETCWAEWKRSGENQSRAGRARAELERHLGGDVVDGYRAVTKVVTEKK